jgi:ribonuclease III
MYHSCLFLKPIIHQSFVGGLYLEQGLDRVQGWLSALLLPYAREAYRIIKDQHHLSLSPPPESQASELKLSEALSSTGCTQSSVAPTEGLLSLFNIHMQKTNHIDTLEWVYAGGPVADNLDMFSEFGVDLSKEEIREGLKTTPIWLVKLVVDGKEFARGKGVTKKAARVNAAQIALEKMGVQI